MADAPFKLATLGGLTLEGPAASRIGGKRLTFLAVLSAAGPEGISRERLASLFWPDSDAERSRAALKQLTYVFRGTFGSDAVIAGPTSIAMDVRVVSSDVQRFLSATEAGDHEGAVSAYRGPFLDGIHVSSTDLERWIETTRARLHALYVESLEQLYEIAAARNATTDAAKWSERILAIDPGNASAALRHMTALANDGRLAAALQVADRHSTWLRVEYDLPPNADVTALAAKLHARGSVALRDVAGSSDNATRTEVSALAAPAHDNPSNRMATPLKRRAWHVQLARAMALVATVLVVAYTVRRFANPDMSASQTVGGAVWSSPREATVAVFPFAVVGGTRGAEEGDAVKFLLAAGLDGASGLRTTDVSRFIRDTVGRGEIAAADAAALARRLGAQFFIVGDVVGSDSTMSASARVFSASSPDAPAASAHATGRPEEVVTICDSLAIQLLEERGRSEPGQLVSSAARTTRSLPAFRAYLDGERAMRAGHYGDALLAFKTAVRSDSGFALAYYRLAMAADWAAEGYSDEYSLTRVRALASRLPERERLLVLGGEAWERGAVAEAERFFRRILELFPGDPEAAYQFGEVIFHSGSAVGRAPAEAGPLFERVIALEPENVEALAHLARIQVLRGQVAAAESLSRRVSVLRSRNDRLAAELRIMTHAARGDRRWLSDTARSLAAVGNDDLLSLASWRIPSYTDSLDMAEPFAWALLGTSTELANRLGSRLRLSEFALSAGNLAEALRRTVDERLGSDCLLPIRAYYVALPLTTADDRVLVAYRDSLAKWTAPSLPAGLSHDDAAANGMTRDLVPYVEGLIALRLGDSLTALRSVRELQTQGRSKNLDALAQRLAWALRANLADARGDIHGALVAFDSAATGVPLKLRLTAWGGAAQTRFARAEMLRKLGRLDEARRWYATFDGDSGGEMAFRSAAARGRAATSGADKESAMVGLQMPR